MTGPSRTGAALAALALMLFLYFTAEVFTAGALRPMASSLGVSVSAVGMIVTIYALVAAVVIVPMSALGTRLSPRWLLVGSMLMLALSQAGIALAPSLGWVLAARCLTALCHGAVWAAGPAVASALLPGRPGRATGHVFLGNALGSVLGAPLVAGVSALVSWRAASSLLAALSLLCALVLARTLPRSLRPERERGTPAGTGPGRGEAIRVARWCVLIIPIAGAHLASYTFLAERAASSGIEGTGLAVLLLAMGVSGIVGTLVMARLHDAHPRASTLAASAAMTIALGACGVGVAPVVLGGAVALWGAAISALTVALQAFVLRDAPRWGQRASSWYVLCFQIGIASGSGLGAAVIARTGSPAAPPMVSAVVSAGALVVAVLLTLHKHAD